jgi:hypothetical protein
MFNFNELSPHLCSNSDLTSETMNPFHTFGRTPWLGDQLIARPLLTQGNTDKEKLGTYL